MNGLMQTRSVVRKADGGPPVSLQRSVSTSPIAGIVDWTTGFYGLLPPRAPDALSTVPAISRVPSGHAPCPYRLVHDDWAIILTTILPTDL